MGSLPQDILPAGHASDSLHRRNPMRSLSALRITLLGVIVNTFLLRVQKQEIPQLAV